MLYRIRPQFAAVALLTFFSSTALAQEELRTFVPRVDTAWSGGKVALSNGRAVLGKMLIGQVQMFDVASSAELFALGPAYNDAFGSAIALWGDVLVVGAATDAGMGAAYVHDAQTGDQIHKLVPSDGAQDDAFGWSADVWGEIAIVGARGNDALAFNAGAAYLFDVTTGAQLMRLAANDQGRDDGFGSAVAIHGKRALVSAPGNGAGGAAYVFDVTNGQQIAKLEPVGAIPRDSFGRHVAIDGTRAVVTADSDDDQGPGAGAVYVFDAATGQQLAKLLADDGKAHDSFGGGVALTREWIVVGAPTADNGAGVGAVYVFDRSTLQELVKLVGERAGDLFGSAVAVDASCLLVGAAGEGRGHLFGDAQPLGQTYCSPANLNSTGRAARIAAEGIAQAGCNVFELTAWQMPPHQRGIVLMSETQGFVPFVGGGQGNLCLGGKIGRLNQIQDTGVQGSFTVVLDLKAIPNPSSPGVQPGDTWNFQVWFRDMDPHPTANLTDAVAVTFR